MKNTKPYTQTRSYKKFKDSPFKDSFKVDTILNNSRVEMDGETGVISINITQYVDDDGVLDYLYAQKIKDTYKLTNISTSLFLFIKQYYVNKLTDLFVLEINVFKKHSGYSSNTSIYSAVGELLKHNIIAKSEEQLSYYINTLLFNVFYSFSITHNYIQDPTKVIIGNK